MFSVVLWEYNFQNIELVQVRKMSEVFERNCTIFVLKTNTVTGNMVKRVLQEQMAGVRSYPSRELFSPCLLC